MKKELEILLAEDDEGHAHLIKKNLARSGVVNQLQHFKDGQELLDFLFFIGDGPHREDEKAYLLLLDIRMPRVDGVQALAKIKEDRELRKIPVIMLTTSDNPKEIELCHSIGCSNYITKPVEYESFVTTLKQLGLFLTVVQVPTIHKNGGPHLRITR
ncbi:MAG: response regulator [bacterium]|nr:response regulator [bacterium]